MSVKASPLHGFFVIGDGTQAHDGHLVDSLVEVVARHAPAKPALIRKPTSEKPTPRDYFRLTVLPQTTEMRCTSADCQHPARLLIDSRDQDVLAFCVRCAWVEIAMWMAGA